MSTCGCGRVFATDVAGVAGYVGHGFVCVSRSAPWTLTEIAAAPSEVIVVDGGGTDDGLSS